MQVPFQDSFQNNQHYLPPSHIQRRPNFLSRNSQHLRNPPPHWRPPQEFSNEFWCETCDRGFRTPDILEKHKQQHQKCNIDGCQFIAHPKVITKHIQMQHASGLYNKIAKLQDPEEIKKWREERKKKYPTKENVEKAAAAVKEKIGRGEKMGLKYNRHERSPRTGGSRKRQAYDNQKNHTPHFNQNSTPNNKRRKGVPKSHDKKLPAVDNTRKLKPFQGIQDLTINIDEQPEELDIGFTIEDEEDLSEGSVQLHKTSGSVCNALSSLLCNYGSADEEESDKNPATIFTQKAEQSVTQSICNGDLNLTPPSKNDRYDDDDSGPEEVKVTKTVINEPNNTEPNKKTYVKKPKVDGPKKTFFRKPKPKIPSTLLRKLLCKEMRQERNIILQCIRHVVKNNFFDKSEELND